MDERDSLKEHFDGVTLPTLKYALFDLIEVLIPELPERVKQYDNYMEAMTSIIIEKGLWKEEWGEIPKVLNTHNS